MTTLTVNLANKTPSVWTFVVFMTLPNSSGLESVAWKLRPIPGTNGTSKLTWTDTDFCAAIGAYTTSGGMIVYEQTQALPATAGSAWQIVAQGGAQELQANGNAILPNMIQIANASGSLASAAFGVASTAAVYKRDLLSGASAIFDPQPSYFVLLADSMDQGQAIVPVPSGGLGGVIVGPKPLPLSASAPSVTVTATSNSVSIDLAVTTP